MISRGTIGSVGCRLHQRQTGTESPLGHGPQARPLIRLRGGVLSGWCQHPWPGILAAR
jgi:hypothetical protein